MASRDFSARGSRDSRLSVDVAQRLGSTPRQVALAASQTLGDRDDLLRAIAAGRHLTTLALSERGSRSQFWAPVSRLEERDGRRGRR